MSKRLPEEKIEEIRQSVDIVTIISQHISLKKVGANFQALCPFHAEKTPSFSISQKQQIFKCFGCGKAGNVFHFLMSILEIPFIDAVKKVADYGGISLDSFLYEDSQEQVEKKTLTNLMEWATTFYENELINNGSEAQDYIKNRAINSEMIKKFRLGYAPDSWDRLFNSALKEGYTLEFLIKAGLVSRSTKNKDKYFDRFRNRLMFPILDVHGKVIAFGARVLSSKDNPKYLNSPETPFFSKKKVLYNLNFARENFSQDRKLLIMEGYTDVIMAYQHGFTQAVATLGTALTPYHAKIIKRYTDTVILVFDGDSAGQKATMRSLEFFLNQGIIVRILSLPNNQDPYDFLKAHGKDSFSQEIEKAQDFWDFQINFISKKYDLKTTTGKEHALNELIKTINQLPNQITKRLLINKIAKLFSLPPEFLIPKLSNNQRIIPAQQNSFSQYKQNFRQEDEKFLLWVSMHYPDNNELIFNTYKIENFHSPVFSRFAQYIYNYWITYNAIDVGNISAQLETQQAQELINLYYTNYGHLDDKNIKIRLNYIFRGLQQHKYRSKLENLKKILNTANSQDEHLKTKVLQDAQALCQTHVVEHVNED